MDEREVLKRLLEDAKKTEIPGELTPENMKKILEEAGGRKERPRQKIRSCTKWVAAAAVVALCLGAALASKNIRENASDFEVAEQHDDISVQPETEIRSAEADMDFTEEEKAQKAKLGDMYTLAADYGDVYDELHHTSDLNQWDGARKDDMPADVVFNMTDASNGETSGSLAMKESAVETEADYSKTNLMTAGVDESDIAKTDGQYIYTVESGKVKIYDIRDGLPKEPKTLIPSRKSASDHILELYVDGDTMTVIVQEASASLENETDRDKSTKESEPEDVYYMDSETVTVVYVYDISDRNNPVPKGCMKQDGTYHTSRKIGNHLYLFTDYSMEAPQEEKDEAVSRDGISGWIPSVNDTAVSADCIYLPKSGTNSLIMASVDVTNPKKAADIKMVVSDYVDIYVSSSSIFLYDTEYTANQCFTRIAKFSMEGGEIRAVDAASVNGSIEDSFAINEYQGYLRILTTDWSGEEEENAVYVLDSEMKLEGEISGIARGEQIYSARFLKNTGYFVTYRNTDPLFTVDFSEPSNPQIIGELKVTGFSEYLHFWGDDKLLGIGYETDPQSGERKGIKLSMFDISDPKAVTEKDRLVLEQMDYSPALYNYKAVLADEGKNLIGLMLLDYGENGEKACYETFSYQEGEGFVKKLSEAMEDSGSGDGAEGYRGLYAGRYFYISGGGKLLTFDMENAFLKVEP